MEKSSHFARHRRKFARPSVHQECNYRLSTTNVDHSAAYDLVASPMTKRLTGRDSTFILDESDEGEENGDNPAE
jgi:hypothetical protein